MAKLFRYFHEITMPVCSFWHIPGAFQLLFNFSQLDGSGKTKSAFVLSFFFFCVYKILSEDVLSVQSEHFVSN